MIIEAETPEAKLENSEMTGSQFGTTLSKVSSRELPEIEDRHNLPRGFVQNSTRSEEMEIDQSFQNGIANPDIESEVGDSQSHKLSGSPSLAIKASDEILEASETSEDKEKQILPINESENVRQVEKVQTDETVETLKGMDLDSAREDDVGLANFCALSTEQNNFKEIGKKLHALPMTSFPDDFNLQDRNTEAQDEPAVVDMKQKNESLFDGKQGPGIEDLQCGDVIHHHIGEEKESIDQTEEGICEHQNIEEDNALTRSQKDAEKGKKCEDPDFQSTVQKNIVNNMEAESYNEKKTKADHLNTPNIPLKEEANPSCFQGGKIEDKEKLSNFVGMVESPQTISEVEDRDDEKKETDEHTQPILDILTDKARLTQQNGETNSLEADISLVEKVIEETDTQQSKAEESWSPDSTSSHPLDETCPKLIQSQTEKEDENEKETEAQDKDTIDIIERVDIKNEEVSEQSEKDKSEIDENDIKELEPEIKLENRDFVQNNPDENMDGSPTAQVSKGAIIVEASEDTQKYIKEDDSTVKELTTVFSGELPGNASSNKDDEAKTLEGEVTEELQDVGDKQSEEQNKGKDVAKETDTEKSKAEESWSPESSSSNPLGETFPKLIQSQMEREDVNENETEAQDKNTIDIIERVYIKDEEVSEQSEKDKPETDENDIKELEQEIKHENLDFIKDYDDENMDGTPIVVQVSKGAKIAEASEETQKDTKQEECTVKELTTIFTGELPGNASSKDDDEAKTLEGEVTEELQDIGDEHSEEQNKEKDVTAEDPSAVGIKDENEVVSGLGIVDTDKGIDPIIVGNIIPRRYITAIEKEPFKDDHEEEEVIEGLESAVADKEFRAPVVGEDDADHSTTTNGKLIKNGHDEDKVIEKLELAGVDENNGDPIIDEDVTTHSKADADGHEGNKVVEELEIDDADKDTGEPIIEEVVPQHSPRTIEDETTEDDQEDDKVFGGVERVGADKDSGELIIEEDVPDHSRITPREEQIKDGHGENKVVGGLEIVNADMDIQESFIEEDVVPDQSTLSIEEEPIKNGHEEDKVHERLNEAIESEPTEEKVMEDDTSKGLKRNSIEEETIKNISKEYEVCKELAVTEADNDDFHQIKEDIAITDLSTFSGREELAIKNEQEDKTGEKKLEGEANETELSIKSASEAPDSKQRVEPVNLRSEEEHHEIENHPDYSETETTLGETVQNMGSEDLNGSTGLNFVETEMIETTEIVNVKDVDMHKSEYADNIKETKEEEIMQKGSSELPDQATSLVPQVYEEQRKREIIDEETNTDDSVNNAFLEEGTKKAYLHQTESEGKKLMNLSERTDIATSINNIENNTCEKEQGPMKNLEESFMEETIKAELTDHLEDEENVKPVDLSEGTECLSVEIQNKHVDGSTTTQHILETPIKEVSEVVLEDKIHEKDGDTQKHEEHNVQSFEMSVGPDIAISESHQEKNIGGATSLVQKGEMESTKLVISGKSDSTEVLEHNDVEDNSDEAKTIKEQHSSTSFDRGVVEGEVTRGRNIAEDDALNDQSTVHFGDEAVGQRWIADEKEEKNIELEPELEDEVHIHNTRTKIEDKEVCEPGLVHVMEETEKVVVTDCDTKDIQSKCIEVESPDVSREEDNKDTLKPDGEVFESLEVAGSSMDVEPCSIQEKDVVKDNSTIYVEEVEKQSVKEDGEGQPENEGLHITNASDSVTKPITEVGDATDTCITEFMEEVVSKKLQEDKDKENVHGEVSEGIETAGADNNTKNIKEDGVSTEPFAAPIEDVRVSSHEEEMHETLEATTGDETIEKETIRELSAEESCTISLEEQAIKECSQEAVGYEELKTDAGGEDARNHTMENKASMDVSLVSAREQTSQMDSRATEKKKGTPRGEVMESELASIERTLDPTKETAAVSWEEDPKKGPDAVRATDASLEEKTKMEISDKLNFNSTESSMSEKKVLEEIPEKTNTGSIHETASVRLLAENLSLHEAKPDRGELVHASDLASIEMLSTPIEENRVNPHDPDVKFKENSNLHDNATEDAFIPKQSDAGKADQENYEIAVETSVVVAQSADKDNEITPVAQRPAGKTSSDVLSDMKPEESSMLVDRLYKIEMKEKKKDEILVEDESIDKKIEAPLVAQEEHIKLEEDPEMGIVEQMIPCPELDAKKLISEPTNAPVILEGEKFVELNEFRGDRRSEDLETTECANIVREVPEQVEDAIKRLDQSLEETKKERVKEMPVDVKSTDHSHEINESYSATENATLAQNLEACVPCEEATASIDHDQTRETLPTTENNEVVKDREIIKDKDAVSVKDHAVGQSIQEEQRDNKNFKEAGPKLGAEDHNDNMNDVKQPMEYTIVTKEMPRGVERTDESGNTERQNTEEEAAKGVDVLVADAGAKEAKDSHFISTEQNMEETYSNENTETESKIIVKELNNVVYANPDTDGCEKHEEIPNIISEVYEDSIEKGIKEEDNTAEVLHIATIKVVTEETSPREAKHESGKLVEGFSTSAEGEIPEMDATIDTGIKGDSVGKKDLYKTALVTQLPTLKGDNIDQESVVMKRGVCDIVESENFIKNTKKNTEEDQKNVEAATPTEMFECAESECLEEAIGSIPFTQAVEVTSIGEVGEHCNVDSNLETDIHNEGVDKSHNITSFGDRSAEESFHDDKKGDSNKETNWDSEDDQNKNSNEANETMENETLADVVPKQHENARNTENIERQFSGGHENSKDLCQVTSTDKSIKENHGEDVKQGNNVHEEAAKLVTGKLISESNAETFNREEATNVSRDGNPTQEVPERIQDNGANHNIGKQITKGEEPLQESNLVAIGEESIQKAQREEGVERAEIEEGSTDLEADKIYSELVGAKDDGCNTSETTTKETFGSSDVVLEEQEIKEADPAGKTAYVILKDEEDKSREPPIKNAPSEEAPMEIGKEVEEKHGTAIGPEGFVEAKRPSDLVFGTHTMSSMDKLHIEEHPSDSTNASSLEEASLEDMQEKESKSTQDEENQDLLVINSAINEMSLPTEESKKDIELEALAEEMSNEGVKNPNELITEEQICANEEGVNQLLTQPDIPDLTAEEKIPVETDSIEIIEKKISSIEDPSLPAGVVEKSLPEDIIQDERNEEDQRNDSKVNTAKSEADTGTCNSGEETIATSKSSEAGFSLSDLLVKSRKDIGQKEGSPPHEDKEAVTDGKKDEHITGQNEKDEDDEEEEEEEQKKDDSGSDAPVMVEASKDIDVKPTPKKSHNILSGVGSKVKHSIIKVKKAITGKSSQHKQLSPK